MPECLTPAAISEEGAIADYPLQNLWIGQACRVGVRSLGSGLRGCSGVLAMGSERAKASCQLARLACTMLASLLHPSDNEACKTCKGSVVGHLSMGPLFMAS